MHKASFLLNVLFLSSIRLLSQIPEPLKTGDTIPTFPVFKAVNYKSKLLNLNSFKNKLIIMDFWATWCTPCVARFPLTDSLQKHFGEKLQILPFTDQSRSHIESFFKKVNKRYHFVFPTIVEDTILYKYFKNQQRWTGTFIWIKNGTVIGFTDDDAFNEKTIREVLSGKSLNSRFQSTPLLPVESFDYTKPMLSSANPYGINKLRYQSILTGYIKQYEPFVTVSPWTEINKKSRILILNNSISYLYFIAYRIPYNKIVFDFSERAKTAHWEETNDSSNLYCYELTIENDSAQNVFQYMQADLKRIFGFKVNRTIENRPCFVLQLAPDFRKERLATKGGSPGNVYTNLYLKYTNQSFSTLVKQLSHLVNANKKTDIVDETGIQYTVDISLNANMRDPGEVRQELRKYGILLIEEDRPVEMLLITDKNSNQAEAGKNENR